MGKVLVVGGAGYLGYHVAHILGKRAVIYDKLLYSPEYWEPHQFFYGDVRDSIRMSLVFKLHEYDAVIWLAAIVGDAACNIDPTTAIGVNVDAVKNFSAKHDVRIIFASTCSVYGYTNEPATEATVPKPMSIYAETKLKAESHLPDKSLVLRMGTLHGASKRMRFDLMVNAMTLSACTKGVVTVFGGEQKRPIIHVRDAAQLMVNMASSEKTGIYNVASENVSASEVGKGIAKLVQGTKIETRNMDVEDRRDYSIKPYRTREELGFDPQLSWRDSVKEIRALLKSGRLRDPENSRYYNIKSRRIDLWNLS